MLALLASLAPAWAGPAPVSIPLQLFAVEGMGGQYLVKHPPAPLPATLWTSGNKSESTKFRAVVLVPPPGARRRAQDEWTALARTLESVGLDVLVLEPRTSKKNVEKALIEDIQSGVVYLKTHPKLQVFRVAIIAEAAAANAAAHYAAANAQMRLIIDSLVLVNPLREITKSKLTAAMEGIGGIRVLLMAPKGDTAGAAAASAAQKACRTECRKVLTPGAGYGGEATRAIVEFVQRLNG